MSLWQLLRQPSKQTDALDTRLGVSDLRKRMGAHARAPCRRIQVLALLAGPEACRTSTPHCWFATCGENGLPHASCRKQALGPRLAAQRGGGAGRGGHHAVARHGSQAHGQTLGWLRGTNV